MLKDYPEIIQKLQAFIRKYHTNQMIKGLLLFVTGFAFLALFFVVVEYFGYLPSLYRAIILIVFIAYNLVIFSRFVVTPLLGIFRIRKGISMEQAARLLGKHFKTEIGDKILNTLQLRQKLESNSHNLEFLIAGIEQKARNLKPIPFGNAVDFRLNLKYVPYALVPLIVLVVGWFIFPYIFKESAGRILRYDQEFSRPAPFSLKFSDTVLMAVKNEPYTLTVFADGSVIPSEMDIFMGRAEHRMKKDGRNLFNHEFRTVTEPIDFYIRAAGFSFGPFVLQVKSKAVIKTATLNIQYPDYTRLPDEFIGNAGDVEVIAGSRITWNFFTEDTHKLYLQTPSDTIESIQSRPNLFETQSRFFHDSPITILAYDKKGELGDSLQLNIRVLPDLFPDIKVMEFQDSVMVSNFFFEGMIRDDFGFTALNFFFAKTKDIAVSPVVDSTDFERVELPFEPHILNQNFYYHFNLNQLGLSPGESIVYYFRVTDNDRIQGPKSSSTALYTFSIPDLNQLLQDAIVADEQVSGGLNETRNEVNAIQDEIDILRRSMLETNNVNWEQQESLRQLLDKQKDAQQKFEELQQINQDNTAKNQQFSKADENILRKQEELQKLFDEVLTDELKELYQKIQEELESLNRQQVFDMLDQLKFEMSDFENRLDRALELFKQLQVERMLNEGIKATQQLIENQDGLKTRNDEGEPGSELADDQQKLLKESRELQDYLQDMLEKNEQLARPNPLENTDKQWNEATDAMEKALQQLERNQGNNAKQLQQKASDNLQEIKDKLLAMQSAMQQQNLAEDIYALRVILDNLLKISFSQEDLMKTVREMNIRDPRFPTLIQEQRKINQDLVLVKDSLQALAKRQIQIQSIVSREIAEINMNIEIAIDQLINRRKHTATTRQQFVMTHVNNLALLLNESMQNMQNQMQMQAQGEGMDSSSGEGEMGFPDLRQMQEQMNQMLEQLQQGHQPMPGESGEQGMGLSEQLARMAAQQEAIRNRLNELADQFRRDGSGTGELEQMMREMERTELDIVTNNVNRQTLMRQQRILTRLLEHERAQLEREQEERRVGETAKSYDLSNPESFFEYNRLKNRGIEMLRSVPPEFKPWYRLLVENYFLNVEQ